ncbi:MAG: metal-dependent hydrolase [Candidatus Acidiferrales bacterium]
MDPVTHALASLAVARAGQKRLPRFGTSMLIVAGIAPDLDYAAYLGGASVFLRLHRSLLHSLIGAFLTACVVAGAFCFLDRKQPAKNPAARLQGKAALAVCAAGVALHLAFDLLSGVGVNLLWPFHAHWYGMALAENLDPWILILLIAGILLPALFGLVSEEIGERKKGPRGAAAGVITLLLLAGYFGVRANFRGTAEDLLLSREYHGREPDTATAFPASASPFDWRGVVATDNTIEIVVVATDNTIEIVNVPLDPGAEFDSDRSLTYFKPDDSPALEAGERTPSARRFLSYAQFPLASIEHSDEGYRLELRDLRFARDDSSASNILLRVELGANLEVHDEEFFFASSAP